MKTDFLPPSTIEQITDDINSTIPWKNLSLSTSLESYAVSESTLYTISGLWMERFRSKTSQIWTTNYQIPVLSNTLTGIELRVNVLRSARIQDLIIQLTLNGELIGINYAVDMTTQYAYQHNIPLVGDYNIYGGNLDLWGTELTTQDIQNKITGIHNIYIQTINQLNKKIKETNLSPPELESSETFNSLNSKLK